MTEDELIEIIRRELEDQFQNVTGVFSLGWYAKDDFGDHDSVDGNVDLRSLARAILERINQK